MTLDWNTNLSSHSATKVVALQEYRQIKSNAISMDWKDRIYDQLKAFSIDTQTGSSEFNAVSALRAEQFIRDLSSDIDSPTLSLEDQGNILIEWYKKPRGEEATIFSVVLGTKSYIYSLLKNGTSDTHGALNYSIGSLGLILGLIRENFGIISNARLKA